MCNRYSGKSAIRRPFVCRRTPWNLSASLSPTKLPPSATLCAHVCEATRNRTTASLAACTVGMRRERMCRKGVALIQLKKHRLAPWLHSYRSNGPIMFARTVIEDEARWTGPWMWTDRVFARRAAHDAAVGSESSFHQGREQIHLLAGLDVT